jgi:general secretion pathway protein M
MRTGAAHARRRKAITLGALLALVALPVLLVAWPLAGVHRDLDEGIEMLTTRLAKLQRLAAQREGLERLYREGRQAHQADAHFLESVSDILASAEIQGIVKRVVEAHGGQVQSAQSLPARIEDAGIRITVRVRARLGLEGLVRTLHELETGTPFLFLDNLSVRGQPVMRLRRGTRPEATELNLEADIAGYLRAAPS